MTTLAHLFSALSDDTRLQIVERLMTGGELTAGNFASNASISGPAISRHLKVLRGAGLITQRIDGNKRYYSVRPEALQAIAGWTMDHRTFWEARLDKLETLLLETPDG